MERGSRLESRSAEIMARLKSAEVERRTREDGKNLRDRIVERWGFDLRGGILEEEMAEDRVRVPVE